MGAGRAFFLKEALPAFFDPSLPYSFIPLSFSFRISLDSFASMLYNARKSQVIGGSMAAHSNLKGYFSFTGRSGYRFGYLSNPKAFRDKSVPR
jgi:hypothetical protein